VGNGGGGEKERETRGMMSQKKVLREEGSEWKLNSSKDKRGGWTERDKDKGRCGDWVRRVMSKVGEGGGGRGGGV